MKTRYFAPILVLFCGYGLPQSLQAGQCDTLRTDIQNIQIQMRDIEMTRSDGGFTAVADAGRVVKTSCLDSLSAIEMTGFGFTPGAAAMITKLANAACQRLANELNQKVGDVNRRIAHGAGLANGAIGAIDGYSPDRLADQLADQIRTGSSGGSMNPDFGPGPSMGGPASSPSIGDRVGNVWDKMKNLLMPQP